MSGKNDPFGSGGKTVIMPTPGGGAPRRDIAPLPSAPRNPTPRPSQATVISPMPGSGGGGGFAPPPPQGAPFGAPPPQHANPFGAPSPQPPPSYGGGLMPQQAPSYGVPGAASDAWLKGHAQVTPPAHIVPQLYDKPVEQPRERIPLEIALNARDGAEFSASNPITAAAAPLLILLGRLRLQIVDMQAVPLMQHVARSITDFERKVREAGVAENDVLVAKYALCGTADDIVQNLPGTDRHVWMQYSMLAQFFQVRTSGVGFFEELKKVLANPAPRYDLLELMHACLCLGFEGQYRGAAGGDTELQRIRRDVYQTLRHIRARSDEDISPRWRGLTLRMRDIGSRLPLWAVASFAGVALVGIFLLLRFLVSGDGNALAERLVALHPPGSIEITRAEFKPFVPPPADSTQLERIRGELAKEIAEGGMAVEPQGDQIVIRVSNLILFASGKADVKKEFEPVAARVAAALNNEPGPISVIGHTDNVKPKSTSRFKDNFELSVARAKAVEAVLGSTLADPARIQVTGKGEDEPLAGNLNKTPEERASNRRVEIFIPKEETLAQN